MSSTSMEATAQRHGVSVQCFWNWTEAVADNIVNALKATEPSLKIANFMLFEFHLN